MFTQRDLKPSRLDGKVVSDCAEEALPDHCVPQLGQFERDDFKLSNYCSFNNMAQNKSLPHGSTHIGQTDPAAYDKHQMYTLSTDSGVGLDSGFDSCDSLFHSSGSHNLLTNSINSRSHPHQCGTYLPSETDYSLEAHIKQLSLQDQHDSLLKDSSFVNASLGHSSGQTSTFVSCDIHRTNETSSAEIPGSKTEDSYLDPTSIWHQAFHRDEDGDTKLHLAIILGSTEVYSILALATSPRCLDIQNDKYSQTALHLAIHTRQPGLARHLLAWGATVNLRDWRGDTPLHTACRLGDFGSVKVLTTPVGHTEVQLVPYSVPFQRIPQEIDINYDGQSCLHLAAHGGHLEILRYLVEKCGADINIQENTAGRTVLHDAVAANNVALVQLLVRLPGVDLEAGMFCGRTPLQLAVDSNFHRVAEILMGAGARQENVEIDGRLDIAMDDSDEEMATSLEYDDLSIFGQRITLDPAMFGQQGTIKQ